MNKYKAISFIERYHNPIYRVTCSIPEIHRTLLRRVKVLDENTRKVITRSELVPDDSATKLAVLKFTDFSLENLIEIGATDMLKPVTMTGNTFESLRNITNHLQSLTLKLDNNDKAQ